MRLSYPLKASRETQLDVVARKSLHGSSRSFTDPSTSFSSSPGEFDNSSSLALSRFSTGGGTVDLPCYEMDEITFGETLGQGGYAIVDAIVRFPPFSKKDCDYRYRLTRTSDTGEKEYALKRLRDKDFRSVSLAVVDMATEAWLLRQLRHPNIIRLYAVVNDTRYDQNQALVLDRLHRTLHEQRRIWRKRAQRYKQSHSPGPSTRLERLEVTKMEVAVQLSSAILYLHKHRLCHRDIKPGNVGFDAKGKVKIFDFGLARPLPILAKGHRAGGTFRMTGNVGTLRYMAPEVAMCSPYHDGCDVYSFSITLWEMLIGEKALRGYIKGSKELRDAVCVKMERPPLLDIGSSNLKVLLHHGWHHDLSQRWTMREIHAGLIREKNKLSDKLSAVRTR